MLEFKREHDNYTPIPFVLVNNHDHVTPVPGAPVRAYYISTNGSVFVVGTGQITEVGSGLYELVLGRDEQADCTRLISIPGMGGASGYDSVCFRVYGDQNTEIDQAIMNSTYPMTFALISSSDHISPILGASPTVTVSRDANPFTAGPVLAISEIGRGFYCAYVATTEESIEEFNFNEECIYMLNATASGADVTHDSFHVFCYHYNYPA